MNETLKMECRKCGRPREKKMIPIGGVNHELWVLACDCIDKNRQAQDEKKITNEAKKRFDKLVKNSNLPERCILNTYDIPEKPIYEKDESGNYITMLEYDKIRAYIEDIDWNVTQGNNLFMPGNPGTRKTSYAGEIGKAIICSGKAVRYYQAGEIITNKINIWELMKIDALIVDDLGRDKIEKKDGLLFTLFNKRIDNGKLIIAITNFSEEKNRDTLGHDFVDRLKGFKIVTMIGKSSREFKEE
jgi:DNA replication protein DnaC